MALKASRAALGTGVLRVHVDSLERRENWEKLAWMAWMGKRETKGFPVLLERRAVWEEGGTKDRKESKEREETLAFEVTLASRAGTTWSQDPKAKLGTSAPWVCLDLMAQLGALGPLGKMVDSAEEDLQEIRGAQAALASRAQWASMVLVGHRAHLAPLALQDSSGNKAFLVPGEMEDPQEHQVNVAGTVPWEERASLETQALWVASEILAPEGRREMMDVMGLAVMDAEARREKEGFLAIRVRRAPQVSQVPVELQGPKESEAEGEIRDLLGLEDRGENLAILDPLVTKATVVTRWINAPWSRTSRTSALAVMVPWNVLFSLRSWPSPWTPLRVSLRMCSAA